MPMTPDTIATAAASIAPEMVALRRDIHRHPEIGWHEIRTTEKVAQLLSTRGLSPRVRPEGTGLVVEIGTGDPVVGFRADLDALAAQEDGSASYKSSIPGVMHGCGHDGHTAIATGIAAVLAEQDGLAGRVRIIFQPAEEQLPSGGMKLVEEGVHQGLSAIIAYHVDPSLEPGRIGVRSGGITSASDRFTVTLRGPGGHTSRPHKTVDLLYAAGRIVAETPTLVRYGIDPRETLLVVFGRISGGSADNVIPTEVTMGGTVRMFDLGLWKAMPGILERAVRSIAEPLGAGVEVDYTRGAPPVINDRSVTELTAEVGRDLLGADNVVPTFRSLGSEDFACYLEHAPGTLIRLGAALADRRVDLHSASFDIDERAIETGISHGAASLIALLDRLA